MTLEKLGIPTVTLCTDPFMPMAYQERIALGMPDLSVVAVPHPLGGELAPAIHAKAEKIVDLVAAELTGRAGGVR